MSRDTLERRLELRVYRAGILLERRFPIPVCGDPDHAHSGPCEFWSFGRRRPHWRTKYRRPGANGA